MATSGTINTTIIKTSKLLEKAMRRIGRMPAELTPEIVIEAQESLFMLLTSLANRGLNLWCVDKQLMPLYDGQATYVLPTGTQVILNLLHATPETVSGADTTSANDYQVMLADRSKVVRIAARFSVSPTSFEVQTSVDGVTWVTVQTVTEVAESGTLGWYDLDPAPTSAYFRILSPATTTISGVLLATAVREVKISSMNRDDYANQPNKSQTSDIATNYYFEKLIEPQVTLWPVPNNATRHLVLFRYRQIQDVGSLTNTLDIPMRWYEAICWHLALRLAFEVPGVDPARRQEIAQIANSMVIEVEDGETDNAPSYFAPNVGVYTR